ncbi:MAG: outer membrane beta-barrel domain-containing protein [Pseudomonadales bacterium]|nr:outer membrane beta-barrel domain-containing protein [Pseudomonadales bacterium]
MESRIQRFLLNLFIGFTGVLVGTTPAFAAKPEALELEPLIVREEERRDVDVDRIDSENFEIGVSGGIMHIEDFGSDASTSLRFAYHITEDFFVEASYGQSTLGQTSFERLSGGSPLLTDEERDLTYYNVGIGWNLFPGESFVAGRWAFKGSLYVIAGAGSTEFGGDDLFTINVGVGYRLIATDWLALHVGVKDHYFESDLLGETEGKHNIELAGGLTFFF